MAPECGYETSNASNSDAATTYRMVSGQADGCELIVALLLAIFLAAVCVAARDLNDGARDIRPGRAKLGWEPKVDLRDGLKRTIDYFKSIN